jgi:hypothetical protein
VGRDESLSTFTHEVTFFSQQAPGYVRTSEAERGELVTDMYNVFDLLPRLKPWAFASNHW